MQKTIIISKKTGRLGNRLQLYAHWIAFALEKEVRLLNPAFAEYSLFFQGTADQRLGKFPKDQGAISSSETFRELIYWSNRTAYKNSQALIGLKEFRDKSSESTKF